MTQLQAQLQALLHLHMNFTALGSTFKTTVFISNYSLSAITGTVLVYLYTIVELRFLPPGPEQLLQTRLQAQLHEATLCFMSLGILQVQRAGPGPRPETFRGH